MKKMFDEKEYQKEYQKNYREKKRQELTEEEKEKKKVYNKEYRIKNKETIKLYNEKYREENKDLIIKLRGKKKKEGRKKEKKSFDREYFKNYYINNKEKFLFYYKNNKGKYTYSYEGNKLKILERIKERKKNNPLYSLTCSIRSLIFSSLRNNGFSKKTKTFKILGCSFEDFKIHLEKQFESWMNWDNKGNPKDGIFEPNKTWDIDHIIPLSSAKNEKELLELCKYTNLQPLCSYENRWIKKNYLDNN